MADSFEDIVSDLKELNWKRLDAPVYIDAVIQSGKMMPHNDTCECDRRILLFILKHHDPAEPDLQIAVIADSPLGAALIDGRFQERITSRLSEIA